VSGRNMEGFFQQFFYSSNMVNYAVTSVKSEPLEGKVGIYDEGGNKKVHSEEDAAQAFDNSKNKLYRSTVIVQRTGEATAPVDVVVRFANGETERRDWDGGYRWQKYTFDKPAKAVWAEVDTQRKITLDQNFTDNSLLAEPDNRAATKWYLRWIFWLENLFFAAGFFS
jgi:hypothetical protein